ncbi:MAG: 50S ribosomal protein L10 [Patescibacteria group bacterium]
MPSNKKIDAVKRIQTTIEENKNIALIGIDKTKHTSLETLRKALRKANGSITVSKTSLLEKAFEKVSDFAEFQKSAFPIKNNTALVSLKGDWSAGLKAIHEFAKKETSVFFKAGFFDAVTYDKKALEKLAQLPGKSELLAKVIGSMKSPVYRLDTAVKFPMTYFVQVLKAKAEKGA